MIIETNRVRRVGAVLCGAIACLIVGAGTASAQSVLDSWNTVTAPSPPSIQSVTLEAAHTALIIADMDANTCTVAKRPRCAQTVPHVAQLLAAARAHGMEVIFTGSPWSSSVANAPIEALAPQPNEHLVRGMPDKFFETELGQMLRAGHIDNLIVVGTSANSSVLYTATSGAFRGFSIVIPVDGISGHVPYEEQYALWHLKNASQLISDRVSLTTVAQITLK